jgi:hypothetical protein
LYQSTHNRAGESRGEECTMQGVGDAMRRPCEARFGWRLEVRPAGFQQGKNGK